MTEQFHMHNLKIKPVSARLHEKMLLDRDCIITISHLREIQLAWVGFKSFQYSCSIALAYCF